MLRKTAYALGFLAIMFTFAIVGSNIIGLKGLTGFAVKDMTGMVTDNQEGTGVTVPSPPLTHLMALNDFFQANSQVFLGKPMVPNDFVWIEIHSRDTGNDISGIHLDCRASDAECNTFDNELRGKLSDQLRPFPNHAYEFYFYSYSKAANSGVRNANRLTVFTSLLNEHVFDEGKGLGNIYPQPLTLIPFVNIAHIERYPKLQEFQSKGGYSIISYTPKQEETPQQDGGGQDQVPTGTSLTPFSPPDELKEGQFFPVKVGDVNLYVAFLSPEVIGENAFSNQDKDKIPYTINIYESGSVITGDTFVVSIVPAGDTLLVRLDNYVFTINNQNKLLENSVIALGKGALYVWQHDDQPVKVEVHDGSYGGSADPSTKFLTINFKSRGLVEVVSLSEESSNLNLLNAKAIRVQSFAGSNNPVAVVSIPKNDKAYTINVEEKAGLTPIEFLPTSFKVHGVEWEWP